MFEDSNEIMARGCLNNGYTTILRRTISEELYDNMTSIIGIIMSSTFAFIYLYAEEIIDFIFW
jgi:hypothetical protein